MILYYVLGKVKDESSSSKIGLISAIVICSTLFIMTQVNVLFINSNYQPRYEVAIIGGNNKDVSRFEIFEKSYPKRVISVDKRTKEEYIRQVKYSQLISMEKELPYYIIFVYSSAKSRKVGLETNNIDEAIHYLENHLQKN
ncbi:hypothetical protein GCM10008967_15400 [Bacillus carboniphilus]|uniref:Uncharacterized protein n=1 Tax=Bacillus carboniphilus TaxID=86663 RepID=A0ABN0W5N8_9BACI